METLLKVSPGHPAYRMGCKQVHVARWHPPGDDGGIRNTVTVMLPETSPGGIAGALECAFEFNARLLVIADTHEQVEAFAAQVALGAWVRVEINDLISRTSGVGEKEPDT
ncbi:hypothetical protein [Rhizobium leguminosarum]|uniref:hypothetical protein n=1 Tax=Rhizobium leguminosarum TaxID=384 RepID=UPI00140F8AAA|nr:hypothetical protein [Rhizobium leguminosarum]QIO58873.1 hypothetical protein HA463_14740 [Rhizobium leguminosarum bv. trifolii]